MMHIRDGILLSYGDALYILEFIERYISPEILVKVEISPVSDFIDTVSSLRELRKGEK